ncbi:class I SAM-dependent methyltransferase [Treponema putidum]|uniref:Class I SAM-dependent methyltransferase n=1 Tax=Treponema putidum TaxID=221027 RepID=A0AAE9MV29_9SPIR|nr:class I SAM-dependent methyltransferase [Treponema putidum]AIN93031.1 conjugal transfer protein [Treponema putidum]TWI78507.1 O-methyltransferase involved in polyketide biosynthesis [Treponema putidum]UTY29274.1 class I SAM-dependent methyltransferase [Treponema putidum]UTY31771.1 class I SAM-dependent methyltransferase [Treponema putidum]UTY34130.1 class I SAM-dependent methyltransferase [Treponema putidum]
MNEFNGVTDTMLIPMAARIYVSKRFPEYFYDETALSLEDKIPEDALERIWKSSSEYTMLASVARYYNFDGMIKDFLAKYKRCNIINLGAGLETAIFRLQTDNAIFYEIDLPEVIEQRKNILSAKENERLIGADLFTLEWAEHIDTSIPSLLIVSGVFQYFREEKIVRFLSDVKKRFSKGELIFDATNEIGIKYANKYVQKTGNTSAQMYFYVNDGLAFAKNIGMELVEQRTFYTAARKMLKRKLKLYTRIAMKVCDDGGRTIILHLKLN